jgi:16S rRNA (cytidine1402-2'-O)-methyltransferase
MSLGTLYLVATPIGNLEDISLRALRILKEVDLVAAEDTRHSRKLFNHYGIATPLTSCFEHNEAQKGERIVELLRQGRSVALISDAGTPAISDPGYLLVCRCRDEGLPVTVVPGPSAVITALALSGLPTARFAFEGFVPAKSSARRALFVAARNECERTLIYYEAPHRLLAALADLREELGGERRLAVARELTKLHEELFRGTVEEALAHFGAGRVRGEIVLLVAPADAEPERESLEEALARWHAAPELSRKEMVKILAKRFGLPGSEVYRRSLELEGDVGNEQTDDSDR